MTAIELFLNWNRPYNHLMFFMVILCSFLSYRELRTTYSHNLLFSIFIWLFVGLYIGFAPVPWGSGGDRELYAKNFININAIENSNEISEAFFFCYQKISSYIFNYKQWLILTSLIYTFNVFMFSRLVNLKYPFLLLLMFYSSLFFYGYGVNTIRAGFAASFLLVALSFYDRIFYCFLFLLIAVNCHFSMIIPAMAMILSRYLGKTKLYLYLWILSIPLSALMGHFFENLFASFSSDTRVSYLSVDEDSIHYNVDFRIDFILYSCVPVIIGYYYIIRKGIKDRFYSILYNTYILANCFWILVIRANFSDRFGYLSWFIYPAVLIYPALKYQLWDRQNEKVALIVFIHGLFTYIMFLK